MQQNLVGDLASVGREQREQARGRIRRASKPAGRLEPRRRSGHVESFDKALKKGVVDFGALSGFRGVIERDAQPEQAVLRMLAVSERIEERQTAERQRCGQDVGSQAYSEDGLNCAHLVDQVLTFTKPNGLQVAPFWDDEAAASELGMGEILLFRPRSGPVREQRSTARAESARILFFTGVRYERMLEAPQDDSDVTAPPAGKRGSRRRRRG